MFLPTSHHRTFLHNTGTAGSDDLPFHRHFPCLHLSDLHLRQTIANPPPHFVACCTDIAPSVNLYPQLFPSNHVTPNFYLPLLPLLSFANHQHHTHTFISYRQVPGVSSAVRAEFAKGDGRIKRKEDDRRQRIHPSETLFVVNFHEETTRRDDLKMLFEPYGELVRIEMKRNYAFVQFKTIEEATKAREEVNGGKLDQSVLTVEYVAQQRGDGDIRRDVGRRGRGESSGGRRGDDRRRPRNDDNRRDDHRRRDHDRRSPPRFHRGGGRSRSRSRSPPRSYRSRSPRGRDYDDRRGYDRHDRRRGSPDIYRRPRSPDDRDRGGDRGSRAGRGGGPPDGDRGANGDRNGFEGDRERLDRGDRGYRA
jgi:splicing factor, arginine/serine-rich 4/5/6